MAIIGGNSVVAEIQEKKVVYYEIAGYPDYRIKLVGLSDYYIAKNDEPEPYIPCIYSSLYAATKGVQTIEQFKTLMRERKAAREQKTV